MPRFHGQAVGGDHDAVPVVLDAPYGMAEPYGGAETVREALRDDLGAADEPVLLRAARHVGQPAYAARAVDVEQRVQQRHLGRFAGQHALGEQLAEKPAEAGPRVAARPHAEALRVQQARPRRPPRRLHRHPPGHPLQREDQPAHVEQPERVHPRHVAGVLDAPAAEVEELAAGVVRRVGGDAELRGQLGDVVLARADPLPADLHDLPAAQVVVERPPAHPVARLDHQHLTAALTQPRRRGQPRKPGPHHDGVHGLGRHDPSISAPRRPVPAPDRPDRAGHLGRPPPAGKVAATMSDLGSPR